VFQLTRKLIELVMNSEFLLCELLCRAAGSASLPHLRKLGFHRCRIDAIGLLSGDGL
jgi:hypothetical protein